jgi:hypothetical protein
MPEKIITEKELFILGGEEEINKPSHYDTNRCITKTRSTSFKATLANLTSYRDLQLVPVNTFLNVMKIDTIQFLYEYPIGNWSKIPDIDIVLLVNGEEYHYTETFHTYDWALNHSFVETTTKENKEQNKEWLIYNIDLNKIKKLISSNKKAHIQLKAKWLDNIPYDTNIIFSLKLLGDGKEKYDRNYSINLLTHEYFPVDVFYRKVLEVVYDSKNDSVTLLDIPEPNKTAIFEYDVIMKKNSKVVVDKHMITDSQGFWIYLNTKDFNKGDVFTFEVKNFKIKLTNTESVTTTITPNFTGTKVKTTTKNGCKLSVVKNDVNHYIAQIEVLTNLPIDTNKVLFNGADLSLGHFNFIDRAFTLLMVSHNLPSYYRYYEASDEIKTRPIDINIF